MKMWSVKLTCTDNLVKFLSLKISEELKVTHHRWALPDPIATAANAANEQKAFHLLGWVRYGCYGHRINLIVKELIIHIYSFRISYKRLLVMISLQICIYMLQIFMTLIIVLIIWIFLTECHGRRPIAELRHTVTRQKLLYHISRSGQGLSVQVTRALQLNNYNKTTWIISRH